MKSKEKNEGLQKDDLYFQTEWKKYKHNGFILVLIEKAYFFKGLNRRSE